MQGVRVIRESIANGAPPSRSAMLYAHDRSRLDSASVGPVYDIHRRDLRKTYRVLVRQRRYQEIPMYALLSVQEQEAFTRSARHWMARRAPHQPRPSGNFRIVIDHEETGDEAVMFDCLARKWRITRHDQKTQGDFTSSSETITEAWYLDVDQAAARYPGFSAELVGGHSICFVTTNGDYPAIERRGEPPAGLCAQSETHTVDRTPLPTGEIRERHNIHSSRIVSLASERFPLTLFEPPASFRKMPVYPSRITMARLDAVRSLRVFAGKLQSALLHPGA